MAHGSSPASWTAVLICLAGFVIGAIGLIPTLHPVLFGIGVVIAVIAAPVGFVMSKVGFGIDRPSER